MFMILYKHDLWRTEGFSCMVQFEADTSEFSGFAVCLIGQEYIRHA